MSKAKHESTWPTLGFSDWIETRDTLHMWTQIVGKIRLEQTPWINQSWHVPLYVTPRGLSTSLIPDGDSGFEIEFDFLDHSLLLSHSDHGRQSLPLREESVSVFYARVLRALSEFRLDLQINPVPNEIEDPIPFDQDEVHSSYDREAVVRFWRVLLNSHHVFTEFRARFLGKCSPVHFFWGSFDMAVSRFSGRQAPEHPGGIPNMPDSVAREAYSHEVSSAGFWSGGGFIEYPAYYSYIYPEPEGFSSILPSTREAFYDSTLREFILPYHALQDKGSPADYLMEFLQSTYEAAADLAHWDRRALERPVNWKPPV